MPRWGLLILGCVITATVSFSSTSFSADSPESFERDFSLRSIGEIQIGNLHGSISIQGWAQDRVRVKAIPTIGSWDVTLERSGRNVEIRVRPLKVQGPLPLGTPGVDLVILAPSTFPLDVWSSTGGISLRGWNASTTIRSISGEVQVQAVRGENVSAQCVTGAISLKGIQSKVHVRSASGALNLEDVKGKRIFIEGGSGQVRLSKVEGRVVVTSTTGRILGEHISGALEFRTYSADLELRESVGFLSGSTRTGNIAAFFKSWQFDDRAFVESERGNIVLGLPPDFRGDVDLSGVAGNVSSDFFLSPLPGERSTQKQAGGMQQLLGRVGIGGEQLRLSSRGGRVQLLNTR